MDILHLLSRQFRDLTRQEGVLLPVWLADTFCVNCDCIQLLGVTSSVRCKARSKKAKANNQAKEKMKNELVLRCNRCDHVNNRSPAYMRAEGRPSTHRKTLVKTEEQSKEETQSTTVREADEHRQVDGQALRGLGSLKGLASSMPLSNSTKVTANALSAVGNVTNKAEKKGFSFLNKKLASAGSGSKGVFGSDFIAFSSAANSSQTKTSCNNRGFSFQKSLVSTKSTLSHSDVGMKRPLDMNSRANSSNTPASGTGNAVPAGEVNLIELERMKKKMKKEEKRKSLG